MTSPHHSDMRLRTAELLASLSLAIDLYDGPVCQDS